MGCRNPYKHMACITCKVEEHQGRRALPRLFPNTQEQLRQHHILRAKLQSSNSVTTYTPQPCLCFASAKGRQHRMFEFFL